MQNTVLVGMSGGIDSAVAAHILQQEGYTVTGVHFWFYGTKSNTIQLHEICQKLNINLIHYDARKLFRKEVIGYFTSFHLKGLTPSPCVHCNPAVKWKLLQRIADENDIDKIATGHYVKLMRDGGSVKIFRGEDKLKDQTYYLWNMDQGALNRALTPLGDYRKKEVMGLARDIGFDSLVRSKESAGLCFAEGRSCNEMLADYISGLKSKIIKGNVLDRKGNIIGSHKGYIYYTIGQKRDLNLDTNEKLCVVKINTEKNELVADTWQSLYSNEFYVEESNFINPLNERITSKLQVVVRGFGLNPGGNGIIKKAGKGFMVELEEPAWALAPGQPVVFYSEDELLGGAIVKEMPAK